MPSLAGLSLIILLLPTVFDYFKQYDYYTFREDMREWCITHVCNGQAKPDTFLDSLPIKIPLILQRGLIT